MWYFLIPYAFFVALGLLFLIFNLFHVAKFGIQSAKTSAVLASYVVAFIIVGITSVLLVFTYTWNGEFEAGAFFETNLTGQQLLEL